ncbi:MAG: hypothetical protein AB1Z31_31285 [Desulfobacterales bacterium]
MTGNVRFNHASIKSLTFLPDDSSRPLSRIDVFRLKNWMLIGNYLANVVAFVLMEKLIFRGGPLPSNETDKLLHPAAIYSDDVTLFIIKVEAP